MSTDSTDRSPSFALTINRILDKILSEGGGIESIINVLALISLISIFNRNQPTITTQSSPATATSPLQKLLSDLSKGDSSSLSPDMLVSLLPLLTSPQVKSKLNPTSIGAILGLINNLGSSSNEKSETSKSEKQDKTDPQNTEKKEAPAAAVTTLISESTPSIAIASPPNNQEHPQAVHSDLTDPDKKGLGRYLNWKSSF